MPEVEKSVSGIESDRSVCFLGVSSSGEMTLCMRFSAGESATEMAGARLGDVYRLVV